ncbi:MAG: tetratricopeptide repeat protein [Chloroflexota bacterium]|nr:tetratricopeptide repeat protein [Chloroflexota bacterium]
MVDKSLLRRGDGGRYELHELIRQYATERLQVQSSEALSTQERHCAYYTGLLQSQASRMHGEREAQQRIREELDNVRDAYAWAANTANVARLQQATEGLFEFYYLVGFYREAIAVAEQTMARLQPLSIDPAQPGQRLLGILHIYHAYGCTRLARLEQAAASTQAALAVGEALADPELQARGHLNRWDVAYMRGDAETSREAAETALLLARLHGLPKYQCMSLFALAECLCNSGELAASLAYLHEALGIAQMIGERTWESEVLKDLGNTYTQLDELSQALHYYQQALHISRPFNNQRLTVVALYNQAVILVRVGQFVLAQHNAEEALAIVRQLGLRNREANLLALLGSLACQQDDAATARRYCEQALAIAQDDEIYLLESTLITLGNALIELGSHEKADQLFQQALTAFQAKGDQLGVMQARAGLAHALSAQNQPTAAKAQAEEILCLLQINTGYRHGDCAHLYLTCHHLLSADRCCKELLEQGYQWLQEQAAKLGSEDLRHSFLENVPANRALIALAETMENGIRDTGNGNNGERP